jgi:hypothetical protein
MFNQANRSRFVLGTAALLSLCVSGLLAVYAAPLVELNPPVKLLRLLGEDEDTAKEKANTPKTIEKTKTSYAVLQNRDIVLLVDRSKSMTKPDCPDCDRNDHKDLSGVTKQPEAMTSRWQWCKKQMSNLFSEAGDVLHGAVRVVLFASKCQVYPGVDQQAISSIFENNEPKGGTDATQAVRNELDDYFVRKARSGNNTRPLLIAIISDACADDPGALRHVIAKATKRMTSPDEVTISILQLGTDPRAEELFKGLQNDAWSHRGRYNIVSITRFSDLSSMGLAGALVEAVRHSEMTSKAL